MPNVQTAELTGAALNWAVGYARCLEATNGKPVLARDLMEQAVKNGVASPTTDWAEAGPVLDRYDIDILRDSATDFRARLGRAALNPDGTVLSSFMQYGPTRLIAGMRCLVASKLGEYVDVPVELWVQAPVQSAEAEPVTDLLRRETALLSDAPGAAVAREALTVLADLEEAGGQDAALVIDEAIGHLQAVRGAVAAAAARAHSQAAAQPQDQTTRPLPQPASDAAADAGPHP